MNNPNHTQHNPNPFDFVPFAEQPITRSVDFFDGLGELMSGYLELKIRALTPMHVVGSQRNVSPANRYSSQYRQDGQPCIPAAAIRGCLRAFVEALTSSWVSQFTPQYEKVSGHDDPHKARHRGYGTFERKPFHTVGPAINPAFKPRFGSGIDVASYLFGLVVEKEQGDQIAHIDLARKSHVFVEDAHFAEGDLALPNKYWIPDIQGEAFMGGARPSASSWWYMRPLKVERRRINGGANYTAEFVGEKYRGRKFYFHHNPENCLDYYLPNSGGWHYTKDPCRVTVEAIESGRQTSPFRIYLNRVPRPLVALLALSLFPGSMRHKLGYGKAYGFGSVEFILEGACLRTDDLGRIPLPLSDQTEIIRGYLKLAWDDTGLASVGLGPFIDRAALNKLAVILTWDNLVDTEIYTYPSFLPNFFQTAIRYADFETVLKSLSQPPKAKDIARALYPSKRTVDFGLYQETSQNWGLITKRQA